MASTPSASALSAVLRCRGKILTRNPPNKRPATSAYSLGLACGAVRESTTECTRSSWTSSTWESFCQGQRIVVARQLSVAYKSSRLGDKTTRTKEDHGAIKNSCHAKLLHSRTGALGDMRSSVPNGPNAQMQGRIISTLPGIVKSLQLIRLFKYEANIIAHNYQMIFLQNIDELPSGVLNVSITLPSSNTKGRLIPSFILNGWSTLKNTCLSLTIMVSEIMFSNLGALRRSSYPNDATEPPLVEQDINRQNMLEKNSVLQVSIK